MKTKTIRVLKSFPKGGRMRPVGEVYEAHKRFADLMVKVGKAEYVTDPAPKPAKQAPSARKVLASDAVLKEAEGLGIDLAEIEGTGAGGRIIKRDLQGYATRMLKAD